MNKQIAIILTSIERPWLLEKALKSIVANWQPEFTLMIGNQDGFISQTNIVIEKIISENPDKRINHYIQEYDCGISAARNQLILYASLLKIPYVLLTADSIMFEDMVQLQELINCMEAEGYDLCGINLKNRLPWEARIKLIPGESFELDFLKPIEKKYSALVECDIVRNFWIANTSSLLKVRYDNELIMAEHEDFFFRFKEAGYKVCCTDLCNGVYEKDDENEEYSRIRRTNFFIGVNRLKNKYQLKQWVTYKNLEHIQ